MWERVIAEFPKSEYAGHATIFSTNVLPDLPPERGLAFIAKVMKHADKDARESLEYTRGYLYIPLAVPDLRGNEAAYLQRGKDAGDEPEVLNMHAWECYVRGWHTEKATEWARKAVKLSNRAPHILDTLAHLLAKQGKLDEAITLEEEALAKAEDPKRRNDYEEALAKWNAVKAVRAMRAGK